MRTRYLSLRISAYANPREPRVPILSIDLYGCWVLELGFNEIPLRPYIACTSDFRQPQRQPPFLPSQAFETVGSCMLEIRWTNSAGSGILSYRYQSRSFLRSFVLHGAIVENCVHYLLVCVGLG